jgi:hypothetical protein
MRCISHANSAAQRVLPFAGALAALAPAALNWTAVNRRIEPGASQARNSAMHILDSAPERAVVLSNGDNSTYPVWYLQEVERRRRDVTIVVVPLLPAAWYRAEIVRRNALLDTDLVASWRGANQTLVGICRRALAQQRPVSAADSSYNFPSQCETR